MKPVAFTLKIFSLTLISLLLFACTSTAPMTQEELQQANTRWKHHQQQLSQLTAFQVNGSLSYFGTKTKQYGRFFINQKSANNYQLKLTTPVGSTIMSLVVQEGYAELTDHDGKVYTDSNVERIVNRYTGLDIPLYSLHNWLIGLSEQPIIDRIDNQGRLLSSQIQQNALTWQLAVTRYMSKSFKGQPLDLPKELELTRDAEILRVKIDSWTL